MKRLLFQLKHNFEYKLRKIKYSLLFLYRRVTKKSKMGLPFPEYINFSGGRWAIQEHEGLITFSRQCEMFGCHTRIAFNKPKDACWYVLFSATFGWIMPSNILEAYKIVCDYRGDNFGRDMAKNGFY